MNQKKTKRRDINKENHKSRDKLQAAQICQMCDKRQKKDKIS